jgi:hypothetical protein
MCLSRVLAESRHIFQELAAAPNALTRETTPWVADRERADEMA